MRRRLRTVAVLALAVGLMAYFLRSADLERVAAAVRGARWDLLGVALVVTCATYVVRAIRWCWLLRPLGAVRFRVALRATVVGFAASAILPGRVGEVLRPYVLARREGLSVSAALATIVLERLLDVIAVLALLGVAVLIGTPGSAAGTGLLGTVRSGAALAGLAATAAVGAAFVAAGHPDRVARAVERLGALLPARAAGVLTRIASRFIEGLAVVRNRRVLAVAGVWSLVHWAAAAAVVWLVTVAFDIAIPVSGAAVLMALTVVGVSVPTPAGIGGYHAAYQVGGDAALRGAGRGRGGSRPGAARNVVPSGDRGGGRLHDAGGRSPDRRPVLRRGRGGGELVHYPVGRVCRRGIRCRGATDVKCPFCGHLDDKVVDSRESREGEVIRRRRECTGCGRRFTSYERIDEVPYMVVKKDGSRARFEREKVIGGLLKACEKRPVSVSDLEAVANRVESALQERPDKEISTEEVGAVVMRELRDLDKVAYVRFASVYRDFRDVGEFITELKGLLDAKES